MRAMTGWRSAVLVSMGCLASTATATRSVTTTGSIIPRRPSFHSVRSNLHVDESALLIPRGGGLGPPKKPKLNSKDPKKKPPKQKAVAKAKPKSKQATAAQPPQSFQDWMIHHFFGPVAGAPVTTQVLDFTLTLLQSLFTWKYLTGETQLLWACHLLLHTMLMFVTDYGVRSPSYLQWTLPKVPYYVMGSYDLFFAFTVLMHFLACPEAYPF